MVVMVSPSQTAELVYLLKTNNCKRKLILAGLVCLTFCHFLLNLSCSETRLQLYIKGESFRAYLAQYCHCLLVYPTLNYQQVLWFHVKFSVVHYGLDDVDQCRQSVLTLIDHSWNQFQ